VEEKTCKLKVGREQSNAEVWEGGRVSAGEGAQFGRGVEK